MTCHITYGHEKSIQKSMKSVCFLTLLSEKSLFL